MLWGELCFATSLLYTRAFRKEVYLAICPAHTTYMSHFLMYRIHQQCSCALARCTLSPPPNPPERTTSLIRHPHMSLLFLPCLNYPSTTTAPFNLSCSYCIVRAHLIPSPLTLHVALYASDSVSVSSAICGSWCFEVGLGSGLAFVCLCVRAGSSWSRLL
jgi:hypothetical protein